MIKNNNKTPSKTIKTSLNSSNPTIKPQNPIQYINAKQTDRLQQHNPRHRQVGAFAILCRAGCDAAARAAAVHRRRLRAGGGAALVSEGPGAALVHVAPQHRHLRAHRGHHRGNGLSAGQLRAIYKFLTDFAGNRINRILPVFFSEGKRINLLFGKRINVIFSVFFSFFEGLNE